MSSQSVEKKCSSYAPSPTTRTVPLVLKPGGFVPGAPQFKGAIELPHGAFIFPLGGSWIQNRLVAGYRERRIGRGTWCLKAKCDALARSSDPVIRIWTGDAWRVARKRDRNGRAIAPQCNRGHGGPFAFTAARNKCRVAPLCRSTAGAAVVEWHADTLRTQLTRFRARQVATCWRPVVASHGQRWCRARRYDWVMIRII